MDEITRFLEHVDSILELTKPVYTAGEKTAVYFTLLNKFEINELESINLQREILKRDVGIPSISFYKGIVYTVIISNPWDIDEEGNIVAPTETDDKECIINNL